MQRSCAEGKNKELDVALVVWPQDWYFQSPPCMPSRCEVCTYPAGVFLQQEYDTLALNDESGLKSTKVVWGFVENFSGRWKPGGKVSQCRQ